MATPKRLDFSSPGGVVDLEDSPPSSSSLPRRKSLRKPLLKPASSEAVAEEETKKKKKKKHKKKLASDRIWNEENELAVLKGLVDFRVKTGFQPQIDWDEFYRFVIVSIVAEVSKEHVLSKIMKLKRKFLANMEKINQGNDPLFTRSTDSEAFGFSMMIWGQNDSDFANGDMEQSENGLNQEDENAEPLNENGPPKSNFDGKSPDVVVVDKITENGTDDDDAANELCYVRDAFETILSQGLSEYQKKLQLEKLMKLGTGKRKELSNEWKALCVEEIKLNIKKLRFSAKLAEAANDR